MSPARVTEPPGAKRAGAVAAAGAWALSLATPAAAHAEGNGVTAPAQARAAGSAEEPRPTTEIEVTDRERTSAGGGARASSRVTRADIEERLPRSAPDALRWEPGVYVQQSAHGQGSPYVRGRTGQQTLVTFDGIRLNTSTWRQGPNQYFFTIDAQSVHAIEVTRGGASTLHGSDAIAGVIDADPLEPRLDLGADGPRVRPRAALRWASADLDFSHRFQLDTQWSEDVRVLVGVGRRHAGRLESGGPVRSPTTGELPQVPAFEGDGRTQLGTGFSELTGDGRLVVATSARTRAVAAVYAYREYDAPRTDQCPPPFAPRSECLEYDEQFRSLAYVAHEGDLGPIARESKLALSYQRQHERRTLDRPQSFVRNLWRDDVDTFGVTAKLATAQAPLGGGWRGHLAYGADAYHDDVGSQAWTEFTDLGIVLPLSRGQYLDGGSYWTGGAYLAPEVSWNDRLVLRWGGRTGLAAAAAPGDPSTGSRPVDDAWLTLAGHAGAEWRVIADHLALLATWDRSFRAPNLDDLTSRQQSGPGFQFENPTLAPERADTFEVGVRGTGEAFEVDAWAFRSVMHDSIARAFRSAAECPPATPQCLLSWSRFQLVNTPGASVIDGLELAARASPIAGVSVRGTLSYAFGSGPNPAARPADPTLPYTERVPLSRIPPLNGTAEARWSPTPTTWLGGGLRWASRQDRLAPTDTRDPRIPEGGTPGFVAVDLRAGWRLRRALIVGVVLENVSDAAYRYHGSSVNGPGRGVIASVESGL